jgi:hypothetical protein
VRNSEYEAERAIELVWHFEEDKYFFPLPEI